MKTFGTLLIPLYALIAFCFPSKAQSNGNAFLGTWEWKSGKEAFRIVLKQDPNFKGPDGKTYNVVLGKHIFTKDGKTVEESVTKADKDFVLFGVPSPSNTMQMSYQELTLQKRGTATLTLLQNGNQLQWKLSNPAEVISVNRKEPYSFNFTVPTDLILTKVK